MDMNAQINLRISEAQVSERLRDADRHRAVTAPEADPVVRLETSADEAALERLAQLEGRRLPPGRLLVAERNGRVLAAMSVADGEAVADPFRPTALLVKLLERSRAHLYGENGSRRWLGLAALLRSAPSRHA